MKIYEFDIFIDIDTAHHNGNKSVEKARRIAQKSNCQGTLCSMENAILVSKRVGYALKSLMTKYRVMRRGMHLSA